MMILQYANAVFLFVFCTMYPWLHSNVKERILIGFIGLISIYAFDKVKYLEFDRIVRKSFSALLVGFIQRVPCLFSWMKISHERFILALVFCGEPNYLEEIKEYIQKNYVCGNLVDLIDPTYSKEHLCIVNESEWHSLTEFREKGLLKQVEGRELTHEDVAFFFLLRGKRRLLEIIKYHIIDEYLIDGFIRSFDAVYSRERLYAVNEQEWEAYKEYFRKSSIKKNRFFSFLTDI